jgi:hypothetical protein
MELGANHQQINYYFFLIAVFMTLSYLVMWIRQKDFMHIAKALGLVVLAGGIGLLVNSINLFILSDYTKYSKRGGQLILDNTKQSNANKNNKTAALSVDYAFQWSYGISETFTLMFPGAMGYGARGGELNEQSHLAKYLVEKANQPEEQAGEIAQSMSGSLYWGDQPFTEGPVYLGAITCFLFLFGMVFLKSHHKWWILAISLLAIMMSWGKNFPGFNNFLFDYLPLYNKFRVPTMTLVIPQFLFPVLGVLAIEQLIDTKDRRADLWKALKTSTIAAAVLFAIAGFVYMSQDYKRENAGRTAAFNQMITAKSQDMNTQYSELNNRFEAGLDNRLYENLVSQTNGNIEIARGILNALREDRQSVFGKDILRSLIYVTLAIVLLALYIREKINAVFLLAGTALLAFIDLYTFDKSYLNEHNFIERDQYETETFPLSAADQMILQDKDPNYRVYNMSGGDPFQESRTSYYHKSIGGYHPAKVGIYDDLITYQLSGAPNPQVLNMLNAKYVIQKDQQSGAPNAVRNPSALGNAWIVKGVRFVNTPAEEMTALYNFSAADTAIVDQSFKKLIPQNTSYDPTAMIRQVKFDNDAIQYQSNAASPQVAIFSEIYYTSGWNATIDGKPLEYFKANYVLRGAIIPAGTHTIDFKFQPKSYATGYKIAQFSSYIMMIVLLGAIITEIIRSRKRNTTVTAHPQGPKK